MQYHPGFHRGVFLYDREANASNLIFFCVQGEAYRGADIRGAANVNGLAMRFNNMFADSESKAGSAFIATPCGICAVKAFKNPRKVFLFYADAIITYFCKYMLTIGCINAGLNITTTLAVFESVFNQVYHHLPDLFLVGKNSNR